MSSGLFNSKPLHISQVDSFEIEIEKFISMFGFEREEWTFIGSFGKKEFSGDVDIAILFDNLEFFEAIAEKFGFPYKTMKGFNQISFGYPFEGQTVQVDLMLTRSLEWSKFIYYSPNLSAGESEFKGTYRNALLSDYIVHSSRVETQNFEFVQWSIKMNEGLVRTYKSYISELGNKLKTPRILSCQFISNKPKDVLQMVGLKEPIDTFEQLYEQIKLKSNFEEVWKKFEKSCKNLKLEIPNYGE